MSAAAAAVTTVQPTPPPPYQHYPTYPVAGAGAVPRSSRQAMPPTDIYKKKILNIDIPEDDDPGDDNQAGGGVGACGFETGIKRVDGGYGHASMPTPPEGSGQLVLRDQQGLKPQYRYVPACVLGCCLF